jgi:hypothetical protein
MGFVAIGAVRERGNCQSWSDGEHSTAYMPSSVLTALTIAGCKMPGRLFNTRSCANISSGPDHRSVKPAVYDASLVAPDTQIRAMQEALSFVSPVRDEISEQPMRL